MEDLRGLNEYDTNIEQPNFTFCVGAGSDKYCWKNAREDSVNWALERSHVGEGNHTYFTSAPGEEKTSKRSTKNRCMLLHIGDMEYAITGCPRHLIIGEDRVYFINGYANYTDLFSRKRDAGSYIDNGISNSHEN